MGQKNGEPYTSLLKNETDLAQRAHEASILTKYTAIFTLMKFYLIFQSMSY
jgi:predicted SPOUT superfamily RNA methylase MTH1